jgi:hypothetical protein
MQQCLHSCLSDHNSQSRIIFPATLSFNQSMVTVQDSVRHHVAAWQIDMVMAPM